MGKRKAKEFVILIALKYTASPKLDPEEVREFWNTYIWALPITGLQGIPEAAFTAHGVSIYGQDTKTS